MRVPRPLHREDGQALVELLSFLVWLLVGALLALEVLLFVSTANAAEHAARNASRVVRDGGNAYQAARASLPSWQADALRPGDVTLNGEEVTVELAVPLVSPEFRTRRWTVVRHARLPVPG